jgi:hypothetical protein
MNEIEQEGEPAPVTERLGRFALESPQVVAASMKAPSPAFAAEELEGQELVAALVGLAPVVICLYTILTTRDALNGRAKYVLAMAAILINGLILIGVGSLLARRPARLPAGRTLIALAGALAPFVAATTWMTPRSHFSLLTTAAATVLSAAAAGLYARLWGRGFRAVLSLVAAVFLLGLSGWIAGRLAIPLEGLKSLRSSIVLDTAAGLLACGVFLRPERAIEPVGKIAMALAVPVATIAIILLWSGSIFHQIPAIIVVTLWGARALRPYFHEGAVSTLFCVLLAVPLWLAGDSVQGRHVALVVGLFAMLRTSADVEEDPNVSVIDRWSPVWLAAGLWLALAVTWANDLDLLQELLDLPRGFVPRSLAWVALFALPMAVPPFLLARVIIRSDPLQV